jgi:protein phosphatase PTC7
MRPREILVDAVMNNHEMGSATCVCLSLDKQAPVLYTANLGDSGYLLLRKSGLDLVSVFRSKEMQHSFNFPFQVGTGGDDPQKAKEQVHSVRDKDILVVGTDGLFDNLFDA